MNKAIFNIFNFFFEIIIIIYNNKFILINFFNTIH